MNLLHLYTKTLKLPKPLLLTRHSINTIKQIGIVTGISTLGLLGAVDLVRADTVNMINSTKATATGSGATGIPSITNFNIPAGRNRVILAIPLFERDHCLVIANCTVNNTAGTGSGSNFASPNLTGLNATTASPQLTARFVGPGGTVNKQNALLTTGTPPGDLRFMTQRWTPAAPNDQFNKTFFSEESYHIAIFESEIQTLLGGATSGNISISLPDVVSPKSGGDDAVFMVFVFDGVTQTNVGIVRSGTDLASPSMDSPAAGNFTRSIAAFDAGQAPTQTGDGVLALGVSTVGAPTNNGGYNQMSGFTIKENAFTTNSTGNFDALNQPANGDSTEPSGFSATAQFRNGVPTLPLTMQSSAPNTIPTMGGMAAVFTLLSAPSAPDVTLTKSDGGVSFTQGSNGTYTLTPRNNGTAATTGTITIVDTLPAELTYVSATGTGWSCSYAAATRKVTCTSTTAIAANATGNPITLTVTASSGAGTTITNTATISGGGEATLDNTNNSVSDTTPIAALASSKDYGDAPDTYGTDKTDNSGEGVGANHVITSTLKLGATAPDAETDAATPLDGTGDGADEDAFTSLANVSTTGNYNLTVPVTNSGSSATLHAWIDFNKNGKFEVGEYKSATVANGATTANLSWAVPSGTTAGNTYARFRLTSDASLVDNASTSGQDERSIGAANDGEVEDYKVAIASPPPVGNVTGIYGNDSPFCDAPTTGVNLVSNSSFESNAAYSYSLSPNRDSQPAVAIPGWTLTGGPQNYIYSRPASATTAGSSPAGNMTLYLGNGYFQANTSNTLGWLSSAIVNADGTISIPSGVTPTFYETNGTPKITTTASTTVTGLTPGQTYQFEFWAAGEGTTSWHTKYNGISTVSIAGTTQYFSIPSLDGLKFDGTPSGIGSSQRFHVEFVASGTSETISFVNYGHPLWSGMGGNADELVIDDVRVCAIAAPSASISGTVFEDPNYGGGAGRPLSTPTTSSRDGATVELYKKSDGSYVSSTTTTGGGKYTFSSVPAGDYFVRVVNSTVTSSRGTGSILPVQTFRVDDSTGTPANDVDRVGGEKPSVADTGAAGAGAVLNTTTFAFTTGAGSATTGGQVQSIAPVKVGSSAVTGIDFGYNFDTIVNTNSTGQGSLAQFILNSNALGNENSLNQANLIAGSETSIFAISDGTARPGLRAGLANLLTTTGGNTGAAVILTDSSFPAVTGSKTIINGNTQTLNIGNTNLGDIGTSGQVGVGNLALDPIPKPEIVIVNTPTTNLNIAGPNIRVQNIAIYGNQQAGRNQIHVTNSGNNSGDLATIHQNLIGVYADGSDTGNTLQRGGILAEDVSNITNNYVAYVGDGIRVNGGNAAGSTIVSNEIANSGSKYYDGGDNISITSANNITVRGNLVRDSATPSNPSDNTDDKGIELIDTTNVLIENNTIRNMQEAGIGLYTNSDNNTIRRNIITGTTGEGTAKSGSGIVIVNFSGQVGTGNRISQNSIYNNHGLSIDFSPTSAAAPGDGVTANNGTKNSSLPNEGMDYPIITSSVLNNGTLSIQGFVGNNPNGSTTFPNATIEFFIADNDGNQNGEVIVGDGKSKPHGEGKTYIGSCTADANGLFGTATNPCVLSNVPAALTDPNNITATATDTSGNTSEFSAVLSSAQVLLVKRITAINGNRNSNPNDGTVLNTFVEDSSTFADNNANWPTNFIIGAPSAGKVKPRDTIEYTIYFMNADGATASSVKVCDRIVGSQTLVPDAYGTGRDFEYQLGSNSLRYLTRSLDPPVDRTYFDSSMTAITGCPAPSITGTNNGTVVIDITGTGSSTQDNLTSIPGAILPATPSNSSGYFRFTTKVDP